MSRIAFGLKAHSGWAALVAVAPAGEWFEVVERRRVDLVAGDDWRKKQPYHAAETLDRARGHALIERAIAAARKAGASAMRQAVKDAAAAGRKLLRCAILSGAPMPDWSADEIL